MTATPATAAQAQAATARAAARITSAPRRDPGPDQRRHGRGADDVHRPDRHAARDRGRPAHPAVRPGVAAQRHPLGLAALLLVVSSLADDYGRRRIFVWGTLALGITTALSALATDTWLFTLTRIAQGAASAALLASSLGLIVHAFPTAAGRLKATVGRVRHRGHRGGPVAGRRDTELARGLRRPRRRRPGHRPPRNPRAHRVEVPTRRPPRLRGSRDLRTGPGLPGGGPHAGPGRLAAHAGVAAAGRGGRPPRRLRAGGAALGDPDDRPVPAPPPRFPRVVRGRPVHGTVGDRPVQLPARRCSSGC